MSMTPVEERVALLLAKAESTTPQEAEALTAHAERLMLRHGIEHSAVEAARVGREHRPEGIVEKRLPFAGVYARAMVHLGNAVATAYGTVRTYRTDLRGSRDSTLVLVGHESDVRHVETLVTSLVLQGRVALDRWWRELRMSGALDDASGAERTALRRDYLVGFGEGAADRLASTRRAVQAEAEAAFPGSTAAVHDRRAAVDAFMDRISLRRGRALRIGAGFGSGHRDGSGADVGTTAMSGGRPALGA
jgi:hypothetical protein